MMRQQGFSYPIVMFLVAALTLISLRALENGATAARRDKETQLLLLGQTMRDAIQSYYVNTSGGAKMYPPRAGFWGALMDDTRNTRQQRHLRKVFRDPITGSADWGLVLTADGEHVQGVFSKSDLKPVKSAGFPPHLSSFTNARRYRDWRFTYEPNGT